jgi:hypothetical protein
MPSSMPTGDLIPTPTTLPGLPADEGCLDVSARTWPTVRADGEGNESPARVIVTAVDLANSRITVRNVSGEPIVFDAEGGWAIAVWPRTEDLPEGIVFPPDRGLTIHLVEAGPPSSPESVPDPTLDHLYLGLSGGSAVLNPGAGEFAIFSNNKPSNPFANPGEMEAFVRWGSPSQAGTASLDDEAARARLWTVSQFVRAGAGDAALVATGNTAEPAGWSATTPTCID